VSDADLRTVARPLRAAVAVVVAVWLAVIVLWRYAPYTITFDDAFYYFQIARNVANGHGSTFNGIDSTNGYHPLWLLICTVPYLLGMDGTTAARALLVFQLALYAALLLAVVDLLARSVRGWARLAAIDADGRKARLCTISLAVALALVAGNPFVVKTFVNGLESGVTSLAYAVILLVACRGSGDLLADRRLRLVLAGAFVVAFLGRTDALLVVGCAGLWTLARRPKPHAVVEAFGPVAVVAAAYLLYNRIEYGNALQVSGVVKRLSLTGGRAAALLVFALVAFVVGRGAMRLGESARRAPKFPHVAAFIRSTGFFAAACVLLFGYYRVLSVEVYLWYYAPQALYLVLLALHAVADLLEGRVLETPADRAPRAVLAPIQLIVGLPVLVALGFSLTQLVDPHQRSLALGDKAAAEWVAANTPEGTVIASWDAGIIGYFADRPVVNLDGVVNSFDWERAQREGTTATSRFLRERNVAYIVNHGRVLDGEDPDLPAAVDALFGKGTRIELVHREDYTYSGSAGGSRRGARPFATFVYKISY
jgi:hypothetical protein